jgi:hydrogenase nickel incorporation protein HypB
MCATCGCERETGITLLNLQTGRSEAMGQAHEHGLRILPERGLQPLPAHGHDHEHGGHSHEHVRVDGTRYVHSHADEEAHDRAHGATIELEARILAKNDAVAVENRGWLRHREILALNLMSSPGSGKTTLLERTIATLAGELPVCVIEGDQATANDGERIRRAGAPVVQVNTGSGCHLDAQMVKRGLAQLEPGIGAVLFIENVGNLVCPALFDLGERAKVVIFSVTEGEDKPLKYPHMFRAAELVVLSKIDLLPYVDFTVHEARQNIRRMNPGAAVAEVSARTGEGLDRWFEWIRARAAAK